MSAPITQSLSFPTLMADIHRMFSTTLYRQLKQDGINLTRSQWRVIANLRSGDGLTQSELAERLLIEKAPTGTLIDKLENAGLVERRPDHNDRRVKRVFITDLAAPLLPGIEQIARELITVSMDGLSDEEQIQLHLLLSKVHENLQVLRQQHCHSNQKSSPEVKA